jgi:hypothetical protein
MESNPEGPRLTDPGKTSLERVNLDAFAAATLPSEMRSVTTALIDAKALSKQSNDQRFHAAWARLIAWSTNLSLPDAERLLAIAELVRMAQVVKRLQPQLPKDLEAAFQFELPPPSVLSGATGADDRLNLARACALAKGPWLCNYLARAIVDEEQGEKARAELIGALMSRSDSLSSFVTLLAVAIETVSPTTEAPGDSLARRTTRILAAWRPALLDSELAVGRELGAAIRSLIEEPLKRVGLPRDEKAQIELTKEVALSLHDVVRTRFSVASEPELFDVLRFCRRMHGDGAWPSELRKPLDLLVKDVSEALVMLGHKGVRDQALFSQLLVLCSYPERAAAVGRELSASHPELDEDVRYWLEHGRSRDIRGSSDVAVETVAREADGAIGLALDEARRTRGLIDKVRSEVVAALDVYEPGLKPHVEEILARAVATSVQLDQAARKRRIGLLGEVGEEIEFAPKFFDAIGPLAGNRAVVRRSAVVRLRSDGTAGEVIIKGLCE